MRELKKYVYCSKNDKDQSAAMEQFSPCPSYDHILEMLMF